MTATSTATTDPSAIAPPHAIAGALLAAARVVAHAAAKQGDDRGFDRIRAYPAIDDDGPAIVVEATDGHRFARVVIADPADTLGGASLDICPTAARGKGGGVLHLLDPDAFAPWPDTGAIVDGPIDALDDALVPGLRAVVNRTELRRAIVAAADRSKAVSAAKAVAAEAKAARDEVTAARKAAVIEARAGGVKGAIATARRGFDDAHRKVQDAYDSATAAVNRASLQIVEVTITTRFDGLAADADAIEGGVVVKAHHGGGLSGDGFDSGGGCVALVLADVNGEEGSVTFGMDARYLADAIMAAGRAGGGRAVVAARGPLSPVAVGLEGGGVRFAAVIMPRRLD